MPLLESYHSRTSGKSKACTSRSHEVCSPSAVIRSIERPFPGLPRPVRCDFRFSQPLAAFFPVDPRGLVSCRCHPWGSPFRACISQRRIPISSRFGASLAVSAFQGGSRYLVIRRSQRITSVSPRKPAAPEVCSPAPRSPRRVRVIHPLSPGRWLSWAFCLSRACPRSRVRQL